MRPVGVRAAVVALLAVGGPVSLLRPPVAVAASAGWVDVSVSADGATGADVVQATGAADVMLRSRDRYVAWADEAALTALRSHPGILRVRPLAAADKVHLD